MFLGWCGPGGAASLVQLVWHTFGYSLVAIADAESLSVVSCMRETVLFRTTSMTCFMDLAPVAHWILVLGWPSLWWNNRLSEILHGPGRLTNLKEYLILQVIVLSVRSLAVWTLRDPYNPRVPIPQNAAHLFMLLFMFMVSASALNLLLIY